MDGDQDEKNKKEYSEIFRQWDFDALIKDVQSSKVADGNRLEAWQEVFSNLWERDEPHSWKKLISLLPSPSVPYDLKARFNTKLLLECEDISIPSIIFLTTIARDRLFDRYWKDEFGSETFKFIAGCINVINLAVQKDQHEYSLSIEAIINGLGRRFLMYPLLMLALSISYPEIFEKDGKSIKCLGTITLAYQEIMKTISSYGYKINNFVDFFSSAAGKTKELAEIVKEVSANEKDKLFKLLNKAFSEEIDIPYKDIISIWLTRDHNFDWQHEYEELVLKALAKPKELSDETLTAIICHFPFENEKISIAFISRLQAIGPSIIGKQFFELWAGYLILEHGFDFFWFSLNLEGEAFGGNLDDKLCGIYNLIESHKFHQRMMQRENFEEDFKLWKFWKNLFRPLGSLFEIHDSYRYGREVEMKEEIWVRQTEAIEILKNYPKLTVSTIKGILNYSQKYWDLLDPVILGLPDTIVVDVLNNYIETNHGHEKHYHALRLLSHSKNRVPEKLLYPTKNGGLLEAVEDLHKFSRSKLRLDDGLTWMGDSAFENLAFGAINKANNEFIEYFDSQYGQDEHEHVSVLIENLHRNLSRLAQVVSDWLKHNSSFPVVFHTSIKRFPKRTSEGYPQEGGEKGVQADLAVILKCDIPELMQTERITFFQAKKIALIPKLKKWESTISINQSQLHKALSVSEHFYYLFFHHSEIGKCPIILPAQMIKDICKARNIKKIPAPIILRAAKDFSLFLLKDLIGLWIGDTRKEIIKNAKKGCDIGQGPRIILEVSIKKGDFEHNIQF